MNMLKAILEIHTKYITHWREKLALPEKSNISQGKMLVGQMEK